MLSLYNNKLNGILADEMGLGKTVQVNFALSRDSWIYCTCLGRALKQLYSVGTIC